MDTTPKRARNARVVAARKAGATLAQIARNEAMTVSRVSQVLRAYEKRSGFRLVKLAGDRRVIVVPITSLPEA